MNFHSWWKIAGASEPSNYAITWSNSERAYGWVMRFTGHNSTNPIEASAVANGSSSSPISPEVSTSVDECLILRLGGFDHNDITVDSTGITGHADITMDESNSNSSSASGGAAYVNQTTAGASGTSSFTLTASEQYRTVTIAIAPE